MLMQHVGVGYFGYYRATAYVMKHSLMPEIAKLRMKALNFWDKHGIRAAADAFGVSTRTLYWWRLLKSRIRTDQAIVKSQVACLPLYYYQKSAMALVDYGKLARELEEIISSEAP